MNLVPPSGGPWRHVDLKEGRVIADLCQLIAEMAKLVVWERDDLQVVVIAAESGEAKHVLTVTPRGYACCCPTYLDERSCPAIVFERFLALSKGV